MSDLILDKYKDHKEYIKSEEWKLKRDNWPDKFCWICKIPHKLQLHHKTYARIGKELRDRRNY